MAEPPIRPKNPDVSADSLDNCPVDDLKKRLADLAYMHEMLGLSNEVTSAVESAQAGDETVDSVDGAARSGPGAFAVSIPGYAMLAELGRGGMGVVYKADQLKLKRQVALKMILNATHVRPEQRERFQREAEAVAQLQHPNIVQVFEIGEHDGSPYFSMEFIQGGSLSERLRRGPLASAEAAKLVETLARAVQHAHQKGVIHRDLKPANVLLTEEGLPKITDFGLAKRLEGADHGQTRSGDVLGTPSYMAPEQAEGKIAQIGPPSDVYALGAILYETVAGRPPFKGDSLMTTLHQVLHDEPAPPSRYRPGLDRDLETICLKALAKAPKQRYASALALAQDLERFQAGEPILARRLGVLRRLWRHVKRRPLAVAAGALCLVAVLAAVVGIQHARVTQHQAKVIQEFEDGLTQREWSSERGDRLEVLLREWTQWDPDQAQSAGRRLEDRFAELFQAALHMPRLDEAQRARLVNDLLWLQGRNSERAAALKHDLRRRAGDWETIFVAKAPFVDQDKAFAPGQLAAHGDLVRRTDTAPAGPIATRVSSDGKVQLDAVFAPDWENSSKLGLHLHLGKTQQKGASGYAFLLMAAERTTDGAGKPMPPERATSFRQAGRSARMEIRRNNVVLRSRDVAVPGGTLVLNVRREQDRLQFQINADEPLVIYDATPLRRQADAVFGVDLPTGVGLRQLRAARLPLPGVASPLERGDSCFDEERFGDALAAFQEQTIQAMSAEVRREATCKTGLCLLALKRHDEAAAVLESLAAQGDDRWSLLAACQLWALRLQQQRLEDAKALFVSVRGRFKAEQLALFVPEATKRQLVTENVIKHIELLLPTKKLRERAEAYLQLADLLGEEGMLWSARYGLAMIEASLGNTPRAQVLTTEMMPTALRIGVIHHGGSNLVWTARLHGWMARQTGGSSLAIGVIESALHEFRDALAKLQPDDAVRRCDYAPLHLELARLHASLDKWDAAEKEVDEFLGLQAEHALPRYDAAAAAHLMKGYLLQQRGQRGQAMQTWKSGLFPSFCATLPPERRPREPMPPGEGGLLLYSILASLTGELTDDQAEALWQGLTHAWVGDSFLGQMGAAMKPSPAVLRSMWVSTANGRDSARRLAFLDLRFIDYARLPAIAGVSEKFRHDAFAAKTSAEQEEIIWQLATRALDHLQQGHINSAHGLQLGMAWNGTTNFLGWGGVAPSLSPELRGPAAYVLGHRYLKRNLRDDARMLFTTAAQDARQGSPLQRLAREALAAIK